MKKILYLALALSVFLTSCSSDDGAPPAHEVGNWELDGYLFSNFGPDFQFYNNPPLALGLDALLWGGSPYEDYLLVLNADGTFEREIGVNGPDISDEGTWELDADDEILILDSDEVGEIEWDVQKNEDDDLWISFEAQDNFIPDIYRDTVTQDYLDLLATFTDDQIDSVNAIVLQPAIFDLVFIFERQ